MGSPRERAERAASDAAGDEVVRLDPIRHGAMTHAGGINVSLRDAAAKKEFLALPKPRQDQNREMWDAFEQRHTDRVAQREHDEQERNRQREAEQIEKQKMLAVDLVLHDASREELSRVKAIVARNFPADRFNPERHWLVLMQLRDAIGRT
jgi:cobalamin biosynthesis protein CobT